MKQILLALLLVFSNAKIQYRLLGRITTPNPAFIKIEKFGNEEPLLMTSQFSATGAGRVRVEPKITKYIVGNNFANVQLKEVSNDFTWPNNIELIPSEVFGASFRGIVVPDGFLVPFHNNGEVYVLELDPTDYTKKKALYTLTQKKSGFFYHTGKWVDINKDGKLDYVTARTNTQVNQGQLIWLEHPKNGLSSTPWTEHLITQGPEVDIEMLTLPQYPNVVYFIAAEFFTKKLQIYEVALGTGALLNTRVIDDTIDAAYSAQVIDLNNDGKLDLLVTNHEGDENKASVFVYQIPLDPIKGNYERKLIAFGFKPVFNLLTPNAAPGFAYPIHPNLKNKTDYYILIAGDGDHSASLLRPTGNLTYEKETIINTGGTVGSITYADLNGNGFLEFFVPNYDKGYIEVFEFYDL